MPGRFSLYLWLTVAAIVALWLASRLRSWIRWVVVILGAIAIAPDVSTATFHQDVYVPRFFQDGLYRDYLEPGATVVTVPTGRSPLRKSIDMLWQAESEMYYRLPYGRTGFRPRPEGPVEVHLRTGKPQRIDPEQFVQFIKVHRIRAVIVAQGFEKGWEHLLPLLRVEPVEVGGVRVYNLPRAGVVPEARRTRPERSGEGAS